MSGSSACPLCGDISYDPPQGDGPQCACLGMVVGMVSVSRAEFDTLTERLARADAVVEAARSVITAWDDRHNTYDILVTIRDQLRPAVTSYDATSAGGEGGEGNV